MLVQDAECQKREYNYSFHSITESDGLSEGTNAWIYKDRLGFVWIGSMDGLNRFDGNKVKTYRSDPDDVYSLAGNIITSTFYEDENSNLWFTTYGAINVYIRKEDRFRSFRINDTLGIAIIEDYLAFNLDNEGYLWIRAGAKEKGQLYVFNTSTYQSKYVRPLRGQRILTLNEEGTLGKGNTASYWLSGRRGIIISGEGRYSDYNGAYFDGQDELPDLVVYSLVADEFPKIWMGSNKGLISFDLQTKRYRIFDHFRGQQLNRIRSVVAHDNLLFCSSEEWGILIFDKEKLIFESNIFPDPNRKNALRRKDISKLFIDKDQGLWVSYFENGASEGLDYSDIQRYRFPTYNFGDSEVTSVAHLEGDEMGMLVGVGGDLMRVDDKNTILDLWSFENEILHIVSDSGIWIVTTGPGKNENQLYFKGLDDEIFHLISEFNGGIEKLMPIGKGRMMLATTRGVYEILNKQITPSPDFQDLEGEWIFNLFEAESGNLYVTSNYDKLYIYKSNSDHTLLKTISGIGNCTSFHNVSDSTIWLSTSLGIGRVTENKSGNLSYDWLDLGMDRQQFFGSIRSGSDMWFKTEKGLYRYNLTDSGVVSYSNVDGVVSVLGRVFPYFQDDQSRIWMSGLEGINIFYPDSLELLQPPGTPQIIEISINDAPFESTLAHGSIDSLNLRYFENTVSFLFASCQYGDPQNIGFQYRLLGYDEKWVDGKSTGFARYFGLPAGSYEFQARTGNSDGLWSTRPASVKVVVAPPFWATIWAYILYGLAFAGLVFYFWRAERKKQEEKLAREKEKLDRERQLNRELVRIDKLKDQFLANTSHELKTPLNGIIGLAESLLDGATGQLSEATRSNLSMISSSGKRLSKLVNDILDFSKMKSDDLKLDLKPVDLFSAVDVVLTLVAPLRTNDRVELINSIPRDLTAVSADEDRLQQILYNLIGNAIKFTREGQVEVLANAKDEMVEVIIKDTGIGIEKENWENIFKSFEQVDGQDSRQFGGAGLGLSVTKNLVELHGGEIWLDSEIGKGATFYFTLMASNEALTKTSSDHHEEHVFEKMVPLMQDNTAEIVATPSMTSTSDFRILVVDDEAVNRQVLRNHLSLAGYEVISVSNGFDALTILDRESFDLILLDIMMPGLSGFEVSKKIREKTTAIELPIIMLTAKNRVADLLEGFGSGANDYLAKPFSKDELMARIGIHLSLRSIYRATGKFVPVAFLNAIGHDRITEVKLGDHSLVDVTVMFADIRDFTRLSESMSPTENFDFVNNFVKRIGPIIQKHGGFVNQYLGDGIMAIFPDSSRDAISASTDMMRELETINIERAKIGKEEIRIGIGMHTGPLIMGIIGDENRSDPATISDTVNTASRLEGLTKYYKAKVIVSEDCLSSYPDYDKKHYRFLGKVKLKGKESIVSIYESIFGGNAALAARKIETYEKYERALNHYQAGNLHEALRYFQDVINVIPSDEVAIFFRDKINDIIKGGLPPDWEAIEIMMDK